MHDLSSMSGLPLWLDAQHGGLILAQPGEVMEADAQPLRLVRSELQDPGVVTPEIVYWMFPDVALPTDEGVFDERGVRHNLLLLRPGRLGAEYVKTWGHVPVCADGQECPEVYGVLHGRAVFLLQQEVEEPERPAGPVRLADVRWIEALPGQKVVVPATYGVVAINVGEEHLVLSNLVSTLARPIHVMYEQMRGAAYYVTERDGTVAVEPNRRYAEPLPEAREDAPLRAPDLGVAEKVPLYSAFVHEPDRFRWLLEGVPAMGGVC